MFELFDQLARGAGGSFAGRDWSTPTAEQPQASTPTDAGPLGDVPVVGQGIGDFGRGLAQEGLAGLLDPQGMLDRIDAQRDLADRFQVVPDDYTGPRLPNTVTQAEYQQIAHTYSDIRLGRGDLTIDAGHQDDTTAGQLPEAQRAAYRDGALADIAAMMQTRAGREEVERLHDNAPQGTHMHTTMVPLLNADGTFDTTNGYAAPLDGDPSRGADGTPGAGSNVQIRYNPGVNVWDGDPALPANQWAGQTRSDVLLAHEMAHAIHQSAGTDDATDVAATDTAMADFAAGRWGAGIGHLLTPPQGVQIDADYRDASDGSHLARSEHQATGIGLYTDQSFGENAYRRERRALADGGGRGIIEGRPGMGESDRTLVERDTYVGRPAPSTP